jgi:hypothetical protein
MEGPIRSTPAPSFTAFEKELVKRIAVQIKAMQSSDKQKGDLLANKFKMFMTKYKSGQMRFEQIFDVFASDFDTSELRAKYNEASGRVEDPGTVKRAKPDESSEVRFTRNMKKS